MARLLAYLIIFFHGALCGMLAVVVTSCAQALGIENSDVVSTFAVFSLASTAMIHINTSFLLPRYRVGQVLTLASLIFLVSIFLFMTCSDKTSLTWAFLSLGLGLGMGFSTANYLLVSRYEGRERSSKLALMTFFYCVGATLSPAIGGQILSRSLPWQYSLLWPIAIFWLGNLVSFWLPAKRYESSAAKRAYGAWPREVYLVALSLFLFSLAEISFTSWLNVDGEEVMKLGVEDAAYLASVFWFVVGVGRYSASRVLLRVPDKTFVLFSCLIAVLGFLLYIRVSSYGLALLAVSILGLGLSAVNPSLVSLGTSFSRSPGLLSFLLTAGSLGPVVAPLTSQWIYARYGSFGNVASCLVYLGALVGLVAFLKTRHLGEEVTHEANAG